jgi:hypothetical protein
VVQCKSKSLTTREADFVIFSLRPKGLRTWLVSVLRSQGHRASGERERKRERERERERERNFVTSILPFFVSFLWKHLQTHSKQML